LEQITAGDRFSAAFQKPFFKECVVRDTRGQVSDLLAEAAESGYLAGVPLGRWYHELEDCFLVAVTEKRTKDEIQALAACLAGSGCGTASTAALDSLPP
jgi:glycine dehydrogenase subunit 1